MLNFFLKIYDYLCGKRGIILVLILLLFLFFGFFASKISLNEDISGFLPKTPENEKINFLYNNISIADKIVVRITTKDTLISEDDKVDLLVTKADNFVAYLDSVAGADYIKNIQYQIDQSAIIELTRFLTFNMPYFMKENDYLRMDSIIKADNIAATLENDRSLILSPMGIGVKENIMLDPLHFSSPILLRLKDFQISDDYQTIGGYIFTKDGNSIMLFVESANSMSETKNNAYLAKCINNAISILSNEVRVDCFGGSLVAVANSERIKKDSIYSVTIAVILILLLLVFYFRSIRAVTIIMLSVLFGGIVSLAAMYFIQDAMSAIALGAVSIIFGISVDYVMPFLIYKTYEKDSRRTLKNVFLPLIISNITTVGAFLSLLFLKAGSMKDFGLMAAIALISTLLFVLIFVPHICGVIKNNQFQSNLSERLSKFEPESNKWFLYSFIIITIVLIIFSRGLSFESDMQNINYMTDSQRKQFAELSNITPLGKRSIYYVADGSNLNSALESYEKQIPLLDKIVADTNITRVGIGEFFPSKSAQERKLEKWSSFWRSRSAQLITKIEENTKKSGFKEGAFDDFYKIITMEREVQDPEFFELLRNTLLKDYIIEKDERSMIINLIYMPNDRFSEVEKELSTDDNGFVFDSGSMVRSMVSLLADDFNYVLFICIGVVFLSLIIAFGRIELSVIAFMPMIISWFWILGIMGLIGIKFNIVNIVLATFIFGLGNDYDVFITNGLMYKYGYGKKSLNAFKVSILLSSLTMIIGIGVLAFAKHPAMRSLGQVTVIGMISVVFAAYFITPLLFKYLVYDKYGNKREIPVTLKNLSYTIYSFIYFLLGSAFLTVYGFILLKIAKPSQKNKLKLHNQIMHFCDFAAKYIPGIKYNQIGEDEKFDKPAVIIFNHQSHLDLMYVLRLYPKIIILTNEWVWNSPFYGILVKYADFYPITNGIENCAEYLRKFVENGYSIAVFPEGTRSEDFKIKRFHKGAFYLAEQLGLDIIPIVFHGIGHILPKKELLLREGTVTAKILPRIEPENKLFGDTYVEKTKAFRKLFISQYDSLASSIENVSYYKYLVKHNYIYKGAKIGRIANRKLKKIDSYENIINSIPLGKNVLVKNCGDGVFTLLCVLARRDLLIMGCDCNTDNISLASNCASVPKNLKYELYANISENNYDYIIDLSNEI